MGFLLDDGDDDKKSSLSKSVNDTFSTAKSIAESNASSAKIMEILEQMDGVYSRLSKTMGLGRESAQAIKSSLGDAYSDVAKLGGSMADIESIQKGLVGALGTNVLASKEAFKDIYAAASVTNQSVDAITKKFVDAGYNFNNIGKETEKIVNTARSLGVSAEAVSKSVLSNMEALDTHNFSGGVDGLAKMAATSAGLRVDMSTILKAVDKAFNPEGAIEMAAAFQRLGVSQSELLDPMRLMNMSQNDPEAFQQSIAKMGASLTELDEKGNVKIAPGSIRRMKELADAAGIPQGEFAKMSKAAAELDMKMSKLEFPDFATDEQKTLLANITQMKDGQMQIKVDGKMKDMNEVLQGFKGDEEGLKKFLSDNQPKSNEELLTEQLTVAQKIAANTESLKGKTGYAMAGTKKGEEMIVATGTIAKAITDSFNKELDISKMREGLDGHLTAMGDALLSFSKGEIDFTELLGKASTGIAEFTTSIGDVGGRVLKNLSDEGVKLREGNPTEQTAYYGTMKLAGIAADAEKIKTNPIEDNKAVNKANPINTDLQKFTGDYRKIVEYQKPENLKGESKTYHSGKLNMDINVSMPAGMDKTTFESLMRTPEFKEGILKMIHDSPSLNNKSNVTAKG